MFFVLTAALGILAYSVFDPLFDHPTAKNLTCIVVCFLLALDDIVDRIVTAIEQSGDREGASEKGTRQ